MIIMIIIIIISIDRSIQQHEDYMKKHNGKLIPATRHNTDNKSINRTKITRKQKWYKKQLYEHFKR